MDHVGAAARAGRGLVKKLEVIRGGLKKSAQFPIFVFLKNNYSFGDPVLLYERYDPLSRLLRHRQDLLRLGVVIFPRPAHKDRGRKYKSSDRAAGDCRPQVAVTENICLSLPRLKQKLRHGLFFLAQAASGLSRQKAAAVPSGVASTQNEEYCLLSR